MPQVHLCQDQFVALLQEADVAGLVIGPLLAHKLKLFANRLVHRVPLLVCKGVAHRVALAVGIVRYLLCSIARLYKALLHRRSHLRLHLRHLTLVARLHGLQVLFARPLNVAQDLCVRLLHLVHLVLLGDGGGGETLHDGHIGGCKRPAGRLPLIIDLAPLLVGPGVPPPGRKGGREARQVLCGALIQELLL